MNNSILDKYCIVTIGYAVSRIGQVKKVTPRTVHVDWGAKTMIYMNKDFKWIPLDKEEVEAKYRKSKFTPESLKRAEDLGMEIR
ncbi:hypothetical protein [Paenibacillus nasutitermitis]|uniref:Uncharacterized protein n=1 Tax=Paenibacillus nasutitermitis TaxID=1652958 RepID=A0A917E1J4_9BACL|nr:hypothetical protein [Paenibacillus nasutitermitis]GGD89533.1 hypothetical protein GCM10010911_55160 [Paenibacillus nasutitermitis]